MRKISIIYFAFVIFLCACSSPQYDEPQIDLSVYEFADDNIAMEVLASEPILDAPVAMSFDNKGRMWVLEMRDYMPNVEGDESVPTSRISILEDLDNDGVMDHKKVFIDSLHQARALAHVYGGLLYAEAPNLWFVDIVNDQPTNRILVDSAYAVGGNVEHQSNGLMMHVDNWIYSAKCPKRYRRVNGIWESEPSARRGQWGISTDDYGRLYVNDNSNALYSDLTLPSTESSNPYFLPRSLIANDILKDRSIHPKHATAINRGYSDGALDENGHIKAITAVSGVLIYNGGTWGDTYQGAAFASVPEANAIKRIDLNADKLYQESKNHYSDTEFLRSTDEGFRPVNLFIGPDGNMYCTDMHRGIIQHKTYMTSYLIKQLTDKGLDTLVGKGRILRIKKKNDTKPYEDIDLTNLSINELIDHLSSPNLWLRMRAQHLLVIADSPLINNKLKKQLNSTQNPIAAIHLLRTLEGRGDISLSDLIATIERINHPWLTAHGLLMANQLDLSINEKTWYDKLVALNDEIVDIHLLLSAQKLQSLDEEWAYSTLKKIVNRYPENNEMAEALIVSTPSSNYATTARIIDDLPVYQKTMEAMLANVEKDKVHAIYVKELMQEDARGLTEGRVLFNEHCATCHDIGGEGIKNLAPSLVGGDIVNSGPAYIVKTMLRGLNGPITVGGEKVSFAAAMPGIMQNPDISDRDVMAIANYVSNAFSDKPNGLNVEDVTVLRASLAGDDKLLTEAEILQKN